MTGGYKITGALDFTPSTYIPQGNILQFRVQTQHPTFNTYKGRIGVSILLYDTSAFNSSTIQVTTYNIQLDYFGQNSGSQYHPQMY